MFYKIYDHLQRQYNKNIKIQVSQMLIAKLTYKKIGIAQFSMKRAASIILSGRNKLPSPKLTRYHGRSRIDPYQYTFLDQSTLNRFLMKQGEIYNNFQNKLWKQRTDKYYRNTISRKDPRNLSYPQQYDEYQYFTEVDWYEDRDYTTIYRRKLTQTNPNNKQLVLNLMKEPYLKRYHKTISLYSIAISSDHTHIAFGCDLLNKEQYTWFIRNIKTNQFYKWQGGSRIEHIIFLGQEGIFYSKLGTDGMQPKSVYYCSLQSIKQTNNKYKNNYQQTKQILIYQEDKQNCYISISQSKDHKYLFINSNTINKSQIYCLNIAEFEKNVKANPQKKAKLQKIVNFEESQFGKTQVYQQDGKMYFWKCEEKNHVITVKSIQQFKKKGIMEEKIIHKTADDQIISNIDIFKDKMVLYIKKVTKPILRVINLNKFSIDRYCSSQDIPLPYNIGVIEPGINKSSDPKSIIFTMNTPFVYNESYEYNFQTNQIKLLEKFRLVTQDQSSSTTENIIISKIKSKFIKSYNFQSSKYTAETVNVPSQTGDYIPLTIIKNKYSKGRGKLLLNVYGNYGQSIQPSYVNHHLQALQNGWTIAYAHVRGGKQKGNAWYLAAKGNKKRRSWRDLAECVGYLLHHDYTHPSLLFLHGSSAGAITVFNAANAHPHLYKGLIIEYPFLDVLSSLLNDTQGEGKDQLAETDYQQFGNPQQDLLSYNFIQSLSPYDNIQSSKEYPFVYIIGGMNDYRCPLFRIAKFVKKYRQITNLYNRNKAMGSLHVHKNENPEVQVPRTIHDLSEKQAYEQTESIMKARYPHQVNWNSFENINFGHENAHHTLRRIKPIIPNNLLLRIDKDGSHHGSANLHDQAYRDCDVFGFMDYLIEQGSNDCTYK